MTIVFGSEEVIKGIKVTEKELVASLKVRGLDNTNVSYEKLKLEL